MGGENPMKMNRLHDVRSSNRPDDGCRICFRGKRCSPKVHKIGNNYFGKCPAIMQYRHPTAGMFTRGPAKTLLWTICPFRKGWCKVFSVATYHKFCSFAPAYIDQGRWSVHLATPRNLGVIFDSTCCLNSHGLSHKMWVKFPSCNVSVILWLRMMYVLGLQYPAPFLCPGHW